VARTISFLADDDEPHDIMKSIRDRRIENEEKYGKLKLSLEENTEHLYKINIIQKLIANDKSFVNTNTEIIWKFKVIENMNDRIVINIICDSYEVKNKPSGTANLIDFAMLFNKPVEELTLELNQYGNIEKVLNQKSILDKWLLLRNNELGEYQKDESMKGIFVAGDTEFTNTLQSLKNNILYILFFDKIYDKVLTANTFINDNISLYSKLFQGKLISFNNRQEIQSYNDVQIMNTFKFIPDEKLELKKKYIVDYKDIIGNDFNYNYTIKSKANYLMTKGILKSLEAECIEQANDRLFHQTNYKVELINN